MRGLPERDRITGQGRNRPGRKADSARYAERPEANPFRPRTGTRLRGHIRNRWDKIGKTTGRAGKAELDTDESPPRARAFRQSELPCEEAVQLPPELMGVQGGGSFQGDEYHIHVRGQLCPIQPEILPQSPLDPISRASYSDFLAGGHTQPRPAQRIPSHSDEKMGRTVADSLPHYAPVFRGTPESVLFGQPERTDFRPTGGCVPSAFSA